VLAEQNDESAEGRRYLGLEILAKLRRTGQEPEPTTEPAALIA
jgi:putative transposase